MEFFTSTPGFCPTCGSIFPPLDSSRDVTCYNCKQTYKPDVFGDQIVEYTIHFNTFDPDKIVKTKDDINCAPEGPVVERKCSKCGHDKMSYATLQLRSADEGQTVFFTCLKCNILNEITKSCEKLITETQSDLESFRNEQQQFQLQLLEILEENNRVNSKLEGLKGATVAATGESKDDATREQLANEAFKNVKKQINFLQEENKDLQSLNRTYKINIENLEKEIENYRNQLFAQTSVCEVKQKYTTAIKLLENTVHSQKSELKDQAQRIESLLEQKRNLITLLEKLESTIEKKDKDVEKLSTAEKNIAKLQEELNEAINHNKELQQTLKASKQDVEERFKREQSALQKVQEALSIAESAVADKEDAIKREKIVKEEYKDIASTIGQVMDEAARKVEKNMKTIKKEFANREQTLIEQNTKIIDEVQNQKKLNAILDKRCNRFVQKYNEVVKNNDKLSQKLELASKSMYEMEQKLYLQENFGKNSEEHLQMEIKHYVETNKQLKERYRMTFCEMTKTFEEAIYCLETEVANLKAENQVLKSQRSCGEDE